MDGCTTFNAKRPAMPAPQHARAGVCGIDTMNDPLAGLGRGELAGAGGGVCMVRRVWCGFGARHDISNTQQLHSNH